MKNKFKILPLIIMVISLLVLPLCSHADFGDFAGESDYGNSGDSWDSGGSWDSDSSYSSSRSSGSSDTGEIIIMVIIFIVFSLFKYFKNKEDDNETIRRIMNEPRSTPQSELKSMTSYSQVDPSFSASEFKEKLSNLYVRFQNDWQVKDITELRPYLSDAFYAQMDRQLDIYRMKHQTNRVERIAVLGVELKGWKTESDHDVIIAELNTRIVDYVIDDATSSIVRGSDSQEKFMKYEWTLIRSKGVITSRSTGTTSQTCPHCGAHIDINHSAVCEYCDSVLTTDTFDWVVTNIKGISQETKDK